MANPFPSLPHALPPAVGSSSEALLSADQNTSCPPTAKASTFDSRSTAIALPERYQLQILGYSEQDISGVVKELHDRAITPRMDQILEMLAKKRVDITTTFAAITQAISDTPGIKAKVSMAREVMEFANSIEEGALSEIQKHYTSAWPDKQKVAEIVSHWPESLKESATYIRYYWPVLTVGMNTRELLFNFNAANSDIVCSYHVDDPDVNCRIRDDIPFSIEVTDLKDMKKFSQEEFQEFFGEYAQQIQDLVKNYPANAKSIKNGMYLDFLVFFRLVSDIWLDALSAGNTRAMDRVSHLMVSSTHWLHSTTDYHYLERYRDSLHNQLMNAHSLNHEDLSALAFQLLTRPRIWQENYKDIFRQLLSHIFSSQESKLMKHFDNWGADPDSRLNVSRWAESELIPNTARTLHFLKDIAQYIDERKDRSSTWMTSSLESIKNGNYFREGYRAAAATHPGKGSE
ncbi:hypothetical protein [Endozoicomonas sp. GU-1]|uniref:hypothetical protein n=1 Tax=Endozoicomonas sp. GU-1 TaxID=3009078 RepID=UPI0022B405E4|nr:hypothetical protein [Endozoicomonas sp. GU-1]WBA84196.1 hypothetical protein O3276_12820 [Endozoicomonas sp. GU-1]